MEISISLSDAEAEALKKAFPGIEPHEAAQMLIRDEMKRRYRRQMKTAQVSALFRDSKATV